MIKRVLLALLALVLSSPSAEAFCGFFVSGADAKLVNNATLVVLMRSGMRTVLSMRNDYQGPPEDFALVVPVPVVLQKENVKTLSRETFDHIDKLTSPRLVEYWEQDPCYEPPEPRYSGGGGCCGGAMMAAPPRAASAGAARDYGVRVEAEFTVGEYDIAILSAQHSMGLDAYLRDNAYKIPQGAEPYLRPYVERGSKFFVAKVDIKKVKIRGNRAVLSPLRFHYDDQEFSLPIRLGLINSGGTQDLIVAILSPDGRYETANYPNALIPTNLEMADEARAAFPAVYAELFDRTLEKQKGTVVTEYAWEPGSCDPCPSPPLSESELMILGADTLGDGQSARHGYMSGSSRWTLTRLHARYAKDGLGEDLVFRQAPPADGGREGAGQTGVVRTGSHGYNNFQARYVIRHPWTGPIECSNPRRGRWGGPPGGGGEAKAEPTPDLAYAPRGQAKLGAVLKSDVPELGLKAAPEARPNMQAPVTRRGGCAGCRTALASTDLLAGGALAALVATLLVRRRITRGR